MATTLSEAKPRQLQIARIRREEDEETWISGEELCTEGSSEDEAGREVHPPPTISNYSQIHRQLLERRISAPAHLQMYPPPPAASEPAAQDEPHLTETTRRLSQMGIELASRQEQPSTGASPKRRSSDEAMRRERNKDEYEEQEEVMLWRPKRGSIKLPHIDLDTNPPSISQQKVSV